MADNQDTTRMSTRTNIFRRLCCVLATLGALGVGGPAFAETGGEQPAVPVEIVSVDLTDYPRIRTVFTSASPYPHFVRQSEIPGFRLSEVYGDQEWTVFGGGDSGRPPEFRTVRVAADQLNLVMIIDATKSMPAPAFRGAIAAAREMVAQLGEADRVALYSLAGEPELLSGFSGDREKLKRTLADIQRKGKVTRVYDALYSGLYTAQKALGSLDRSAAAFADQSSGGEARTAVLLLTDARDEDSFLNDEDCLALSELGRRMSIPIYVGLYGRSKKSEPRLLKRLTLITGGELLTNPAPDQAGDLLREFRRLPRGYYEITYTSPAAELGQAGPGAKVRQRVALLSNGSEYANVYDYQVPFWAWVQLQLFTIQGFLFVLLFLICVLLLVLFWILRRQGRRGIAPIREVRAEAQSSQTSAQTNLAGDRIPPYPDDSGDAGDARDIAPYLLGDRADIEPGQVHEHGRRHGHYESAGVLMDDERTLYMREYTYRTTQMAVRQGVAYRRAALILENRGGEARQQYDLFLDTTVLGSGRWANIPLRDETVSAVHAKVKRIDQRYIAYDLLSAGGVYINGRKLLRPRALHDGDELRIGRSRFTFRGVK